MLMLTPLAHRPHFEQWFSTLTVCRYHLESFKEGQYLGATPRDLYIFDTGCGLGIGIFKNLP